jgi:hypothetical protein
MKRTEKIGLIKTQKYFVKKDIFVYIILAVFMILIIAGIFLFNNKTGSDAYVYSNGELIKIMPLETDDSFLYEYEEHYNLIVIQDGFVYIEEADCNDRICISKGKINKIGDSIICLPHKLVIKIKGDAEPPADL